MQCPKCRLTNPPTAERCDCGYDFGSAITKTTYLGERDLRIKKGPSLKVAAIFAVALIGVELIGFYLSIEPFKSIGIAIYVMLFGSPE